MGKRLAVLLTAGICIGWGVDASDFDDLGIPSSGQDISSDFLYKEESTDITNFRRKLANIRQWSPKAQDMESRLQKMYNGRVKSLVTLLTKINDTVKSLPNKELSTMALDKDAKSFYEIFKCQGFKTKRDESLSTSSNSGTKVEYVSYRDEDKSDDNIVTSGEINKFKTKTTKDNDELAINFILNEKLDLLEKLGYPNFSDDALEATSRFCAIFNQYLRRDIYFLIAKTDVSGLLGDYAKRDTILIDYYAKVLLELQNKGVLAKTVDFKRVSFDMKAIYSNITRGKITSENYTEYEFYFEYMNDVFLDEGLIDEVPEVNMKPRRPGLDKELKEYTDNILLQKILEQGQRSKR